MKPSVIRSLAASLSSRPSARADTIAGTARLAAPAASANRRRDSFASLFIASPPDLVAPRAGVTPASHRPSLTRPPLRQKYTGTPAAPVLGRTRSEEHTSELQSHVNLVCRLLLEKKKNNT